MFLTCRAPRGPIRADLVGDIVKQACTSAGLPRVGPHRLRHALAGELLNLYGMSETLCACMVTPPGSSNGERTGQPLEKIARDTERDYFLTADEAKDYGLVDQVISKRG